MLESPTRQNHHPISEIKVIWEKDILKRRILLQAQVRNLHNRANNILRIEMEEECIYPIWLYAKPANMTLKFGVSQILKEQIG